MPKKISDSDQVPDPVRARLQESSRVAALAQRAASRPAPAPSPAPRAEPPPAAREATKATQPESRSVTRQARDSRPSLDAGTDQEAATAVRKARFTPSEAEANLELVQVLARLTNSKPSESGVTRILWALLREAEADLKRMGRARVSLRRPPNGSSIEMAAYERDLGRFILGALKSLEI